MKYSNSILATVVCASRAFLTVAVASSFLFGCVGTALNQTSQAAPTQFAGLYFRPTNGYVGYHMVSTSRFAQSPCAAGEKILYRWMSAQGTAPPGLDGPGSIVQSDTDRFEGTPQQAGDWDLQVTVYHLNCSANGERGPIDYGDLTGTVHFHIDPGSKFQRIQ